MDNLAEKSYGLSTLLTYNVFEHKRTYIVHEIYAVTSLQDNVGKLQQVNYRQGKCYYLLCLLL